MSSANFARVVWRLGMVRSGDWAKCNLVTRPNAVGRLRRVLSGNWAWCGLETGSSVVRTGDQFTLETLLCAAWRVDALSTSDWARCCLEPWPCRGLETGCVVVWRWDPVCPEDWAL
ncbi:hypothetical protein chiPu_0028544, partial [Chiloscyllium punctatum]|nr:hypothetical protein [Chiloscyllium punctatum]